jgi:hypothetical protein
VRCGQAGDAGTDDGHTFHRAARLRKKPVEGRPAANEGGREEEEKCSGIATGRTGRPHDRKTLLCRITNLDSQPDDGRMRCCAKSSRPTSRHDVTAVAKGNRRCKARCWFTVMKTVRSLSDCIVYGRPGFVS